MEKVIILTDLEFFLKAPIGEACTQAPADLVCAGCNEAPSTCHKNLSLGCQLKSTQTHRETRIARMDQSRISNRSSAIKDNYIIHPSISDQSYISTRVFYKK